MEEEIKKRLKRFLSRSRYKHTINVQKIAINLAKRFNLNKSDTEKVSLTSLLHDVAKCFNKVKSLKIIKLHKKEFDKLELDIPEIWHTKISAIVAREKFGIKDKSILKAVKLHATGGSNMSLIDKIIYIADVLDISKNIKGIDKVKRALKNSIDSAMLETIRLKISYLIKRGLKIHPNSLKAWNYIIK